MVNALIMKRFDDFDKFPAAIKKNSKQNKAQRKKAIQQVYINLASTKRQLFRSKPGA